MAVAVPFQTIVHADWSTSPRKRWLVIARRDGAGWRVSAPRPVGDMLAFVDELFSFDGPTLAGFDFPIGLPVTYGLSTGLASFPLALENFGHDEWADFYKVADTAEQVALRRPFYPRVSTAAAKQLNLLQGIGVDHIDVLRRRCERATPTRRAACSLFWTLGGNQVGKAAISGWQEIVLPARRRGASLWPFDGDLGALAAPGRLVITETYPAEAYGHVGIAFRTGMSKQRQSDRQAATERLGCWARRHGVLFSEDLIATIETGFGPRKSGEDPFDALAGALGMIEVVEGRRAERAAPDHSDAWEGWILGQQ